MMITQLCKSILAVAFVSVGLLPMRAESAAEYESFDIVEGFESGMPTGWTASQGMRYFVAETSTSFGVSAPNGNWLLGVPETGANYGTQSVTTAGYSLAGGKECGVAFYYYAPGTIPTDVRYVITTVTATLEDSEESYQVCEITEANTEWELLEFSFTPATEGVYHFTISVVGNSASCGVVAFDDFEVYGERPLVNEPGQVTTLAGLYSSALAEDYLYTGEAVVTYVDEAANQVYVQDASRGFRLVADNLPALAVGDVLTRFQGSLFESDGVRALQISYFGQLLSTGAPVHVTTVTLQDLAANPANYVSDLVLVKNVQFEGTEDGDVFENIAYTITDATGSATFKLFDGSDLLDEAVPTTGVYSNLTAIALSADQAVLAPRSQADLVEVIPEVPHDTQALPYYQPFDDADDYDGTSMLPIGWMASGDMPFVTANLNELPAVSGSYYMVAPESNVARNDKAYTPFFSCEAGKVYHITFQLYLPGTVINDIERMNSLSFTAGTEQDAEHQVELAAYNKEIYAQWTPISIDFTAPTTDEYCFAFNLTTEVGYCGYVAVDDFMVLADGQVQRPIAQFAVNNGWYDIMNSKVVVFDNGAIELANISQYATEYSWTVTGAEEYTSTEASPSFPFATDGSYTISLTATNTSGSRTNTKTIEVEHFSGQKSNQGLMTYNPSDDKYLWYYNQLPTFQPEKFSDPNYQFDYITGINHYYKQFAERFELPEGNTATINSISTWIVAYSRMSAYTAEERNHPFSISFYGETDGRLDESKCFGHWNSDMVTAFPTVGFGYEHPAQWGFDVSEVGATVEGPFYVAFEYSDDMPIDSPDPNITRSYVAFGMVEHGSKATTIYGKAKAGADPNFVPDGGWYRLDQIDPSMRQGYGTYMVLWCDLNMREGVVAIDRDGNTVFDLRLDGDLLHVSGTTEGERVAIYTLSGAQVLTANGQADATAINVAALQRGVYVVVTQAGARKFIR